MTKQKSRRFWQRIKIISPTLSLFFLVILLAFLGSSHKNSSKQQGFNSFSVSPDSLSESYMLANLSSRLNLASADALAGDYVTFSVISEVGQTTPERIDKPTIIDTSHLSRGVKSYQFKSGDTLEAIAKKFQLTTDQIRWSNNLANNKVAIGRILDIPSIAGIVYTIKDQDTVESLAKKYQSNPAQIVSFNDLDVKNELKKGHKIILPGGILPVKERPEYVSPRSNPRYTYTYLGSGWHRQNMRRIGYCSWCYIAGNPGVPGECTWFSWAWRARYGRPLPSGPLGHAYSWAYSLSSYGVNNTPSVGAVFQNNAGYYGHVGIVTALNEDGSITVQEMNYAYERFVIKESEIPANLVRSYRYIH